jgi:hypothetical protein
MEGTLAMGEMLSMERIIILVITITAAIITIDQANKITLTVR